MKLWCMAEGRKDCMSTVSAILTSAVTPAFPQARPRRAQRCSEKKCECCLSCKRLPMDSSHIPWIADTGAQDLLSRADAQHVEMYESPWPLKFAAANRNIFGMEQADVKIK